MVCRPSFDGLASTGLLRGAPATADFQQDERVGRRSFDRLRTNGWGCFEGLPSTGLLREGLPPRRTFSRTNGWDAGPSTGSGRTGGGASRGFLRRACFEGLPPRRTFSRTNGWDAGPSTGSGRTGGGASRGFLRRACFEGLPPRRTFSRTNGWDAGPSTGSGRTGGGASTGFLRRAQEERAGLLRRASFDRLRTNGWGCFEGLPSTGLPSTGLRTNGSGGFDRLRTNESGSFGGRPSTGSGRTGQGPSAGSGRTAGVLRRASFSKAACEVDCAATGLMQPRFPRAANWPGRKIQGRASGPHGPTGCKLDWKTIAIRARDIRGRDVLRVSSQPSKQPYDKCYQCNSTHSSPQVSVDSHLSTGSHDSGPCESNRIGGGPKVSPTGSPGVSVGQACVASESCSFPNVPLTDQSWNCSIESHFHCVPVHGGLLLGGKPWHQEATKGDESWGSTSSAKVG